MNIICEMFISDFFKLSSGHIALVGRMVPDVESFIFKCKADLYIGNKKIKTINLIGEDRFSGVDKEKNRGIRAVRTEDDIITYLNEKGNGEIKLVIFS